MIAEHASHAHVATAPPLNLVQRIREEFEERSGLRMTVREAARFWGLEEATCEQVLGQLLATGFLTRGADDRYRQR